MSSGCSILHLVECLHKTALTVKHHGYHCNDTTQHDDALYEIVDGCCLISAQNHVHSCEQCHDDDAVLIGDAETHVEELGDATIDTSRVRNEEHERNDGGSNAQTLIAETGAKEIWHCA